MKGFIETLQNIWKIEDLRTRILYTLGLIFIFRVGSFVVLPGIDPIAFKASLGTGTGRGLADLINIFSGGGFNNASVLALGIMPYISASIAVPLLIQSYGIFLVAYFAARLWRVPFNVAAPCALIGTSNFFELAVAVAISLFGLNSGAALATVVGVLVEVPVMLSLVAFANRTRHWFPNA